MLALDPPGDPTIGACLAGDLSGPRRHRYGAVRDLVIGVTVVLADGTVASSGGKVVKNVAGYDLGKLFCGSRGRLGLIARVALRLHPRPAARGDGRRRDRRSARAVAASSSARSSRRRAVDFLPPGRFALLFEGGEAAVDAQVEACPGVSAAGHVPSGTRRPRGSSRAGGRARVRLAGLPARAARAGDRVRRRAGRPRRGRRSPSACAPPSTPRACSSSGPRSCSATACTAASACRRARPTRSGTRRWTRRAGGSG